ncbi:MAG: nuclear transport factor 2 family protein [Terriglobales bacterium]
MDKHAMEQLWKVHTDEEFLRHDVEATLATMTDDAFVLNIPTGMGGRGKNEVRTFYRDSFVHSLPSDIVNQPTHRVVGDDALVDELLLSFTHTTQMDWVLPGVPPTNKKVAVDLVAVVYFRDNKICGERIYWDHARVLQQVGLITVKAAH